MKAKYLSMAALALMGALASCQSDDDFTVARPDNAVSVNFSVGSLLGTTRSNAIATDDTQREFNQGDQISVSTNDQEAVLFQCTSTENQTWTEAVPNKFLLWTQNMLTFSAYYPVTTGTSMTTFTVPTDQSSEAKIALADYMTRQQNISRPEGGSDIQMQLERKMARVIVRISGFGSQYRDDQKTVDNVRIYSEASGIENGNPTGSSTEIQPYAQGSNDGWGWSQNSTFTALVVPGYGDSSARFIQLSDGEGSTLLVKGIPELEAGNSYTFNLVVGKNRIEVASVTVTDWATGETLAGGQAQEQGSGLTYPIALSAVTADYLGSVVGADGKIYADVAAAKAASTTACAIIAYVGSETGEASPYNHGLAIAMKDASAGYLQWKTSKGSNDNTNQYTEPAPAIAAKESGSALSSGRNNSTWPAFEAALANSIDVTDGISAAAPTSGTSGWFLPSLYQWNMIVKGLSGQSADLSWDPNDNYNASSLNTKIEAAGGTGLLSFGYWSSTEYDGDYALSFGAGFGSMNADTKSGYNNVRSAFAF